MFFWFIDSTMLGGTLRRLEIKYKYMEGFKKPENNSEKENFTVNLDNDKLEEALVGEEIETGLDDLLKVFAIINKLVTEGAHSPEIIKMLAKDLLERYEAEILTYRDIFTKGVVRQIADARCPISKMNFKINTIDLSIDSESTLESVFNKYLEFIKEDPEKKAKRIKEREIEEANITEEAMRLFTDLSSLNFKDYTAVLEWLKKYNELASWSHIYEAYNDMVIEIFESHGFFTSKNDKMDYAVAEAYKDKAGVAQVVIACILANLGLLREQEMNDLIKKYQEVK